MLTSHYMLIVGAVCLLAFAAVWLWQVPGLVRGAITPEELDGYLAKVAATTLPAAEKADMQARLREWAASDDGKPIYMLNLMRYHEELRRFPGAPEFQGAPQDANAHYENNVVPLALSLGAYPMMAGSAQGRNTLMIGGKTSRHDIHAAGRELDEWSRIIMMRYPSRRTFFKLVTHPNYLPYMPYKFMAQQVVLVPVSTDLTFPEWRWLAGGILLALFLGLGWLGALLS
ncbi:hypothetical protein E4T66_10210 [Sinimarinibacterium sp. CAU 1509]|uniref:hypothetical protein n=1 Tax=Sinimarinibacterium sp. CAU 1509 TaxID=2562283 RepID=UPI0010ABEBCB|nr:hypothetical protein [Sinimarinibacterium sp. CAU 1509]TJY61004.1 hypothetical protein E4T66_10210 [Sinimarinibacterium sp. CAU 1509]